MPTRFTPLSLALRADLFTQLGAMEKAGLPPLQALGLIRLPDAIQSRVATMRKQLTRGDRLALAGEKSGVFTALEACLINAVSQTGSPLFMYQRLARHYTQRALQFKQIRARLVLPGVMLLAGLMIRPLPGLISGAVSSGAYLAHVLQPLLLIALLWRLLKWRSERLQASALVVDSRVRKHRMPADWRIQLALLNLKIPVFGAITLRRNLRDFFETLGLLIEAGVPILDALPYALQTMHQPSIRYAFSEVKLRIQQGATLAQALAEIEVLKNDSAIDLIVTGEASGALPEMLLRYADSQTAAIDLFHQQLAEWLPRLVYALVAGWIAYGILAGTAPVPVPADL